MGSVDVGDSGAHHLTDSELCSALVKHLSLNISRIEITSKILCAMKQSEV